MSEQATVTRATPPARPEQAAPPPELTAIEPTRGFGRVLAPRELWRYRDLAFQIAARDVTVRYRQTAFGAAWAIMQPLAFMVVFSLIFGRVAGISSGDVPYALFTLAALVPWMFLANSFLLGSESLVLNQAMVSKTYFPRIFLPFGVIAAGCVDFSVSMVILIVIVFAYGIVPSLAILALPLLVLITIVTALGASAAFSAINVRYRDVRYVIPFATQMWLFLTPVVYRNSELSEPWQTISAINPMVGVVEGFRWAVLDSGSAPLDPIAISAVSALVLLVAGLAYFDRVERSFADLI
jgi:lipopolysaccharide transport system permease protein